MIDYVLLMRLADAAVVRHGPAGIDLLLDLLNTAKLMPARTPASDTGEPSPLRVGLESRIEQLISLYHGRGNLALLVGVALALSADEPFSDGDPASSAKAIGALAEHMALDIAGGLAPQTGTVH